MRILINRYRNRRVLLIVFLFLSISCVFTWIKREEIIGALQKQIFFRTSFWRGEPLKNIQVDWGADVAFQNVRLRGRWGNYYVDILTSKIRLNIDPQNPEVIKCILENPNVGIKRKVEKYYAEDNFVVVTDVGREFKVPLKNRLQITINNGSIRMGEEPFMDNVYGNIEINPDGVLIKSLHADARGFAISADGGFKNTDRGYLNIRFNQIYGKDKKFLGRYLIPDNFSIRAAYNNGVWDINTSVDILEERFVLSAEYKTGTRIINFKSIEGLEQKATGFLDFDKQYVKIQTFINDSEIIWTSKLEDQKLIFTADLKNLEVGGNILHTRVTGHANIGFEDNHLKISEGIISTQNTFINQKPFREFRCRFSVSNDTFVIYTLNLGDEYAFSGNVLLKKPYTVNGRINITNADMKDIVETGNMKRGSLEGSVNGWFNIKGDLFEPDTLHISGELRSSKGRIRNIPLTSGVLKVEGNFPVLEIKDSFMVSGEHRYRMVGNIDLSKLGGGNPYKNVRFINKKEQIVWEGWGITKGLDGSKLNLKRNVSKNVSIGVIVGLQEQSSLAQEKQPTTQIEIEYGLTNGNSLKMSVDEYGEFLGLQKRINF
jgi:hypothetical protein